MSRRSFRDPQYYTDPRSRIDGRTGEARSMGLRNVKRDMDGTVIGANLPDGTAVGTNVRNRPGQSATPRLDAGVQTPNLDANPRQPVLYTSAGDLAAQDRTAAREGSLRGDFGIAAQQRAQNLEGRKSLFRDMKMAGAAGITPAMEAKAKELGVSGPAWKRTVGNIQQAPYMIAAGTGAAKPAQSVIPSSIARPALPPTGAAKANADIAQYGVMGAVQRSLATSDAAKTQKAQSKWRTATATPPASPMAPLKPKPLPQSLGLTQAVPAGTGYPDLPPAVASADSKRRSKWRNP